MKNSLDKTAENKNKEKRKASVKAYYEKNKEKIKEYKKNWALKNKEKIKKQKSEYNAFRQMNDIEYREKRKLKAKERYQKILKDPVKLEHFKSLCKKANLKRLENPETRKKIAEYQKKYRKSSDYKEKHNYAKILKRYDNNEKIAEIIYLCNRIRREEKNLQRRRSCKRKGKGS